ncbi:MAG: neutral/alkaline non-lysosomal ceramidase N-terminal domain-containing protein [Chitinophagaceae bacterium]
MKSSHAESVIEKAMTREILQVVTKGFSMIELPLYTAKKYLNHFICSLLVLLQPGDGYLTAQSPTPPPSSKQAKVFMAGAATSNITPRIGTSINGNMEDARIENIHDEIHARAIVLDDGVTRLAIVVADLCMVSREILDEAKRLAHGKTRIAVENMMISATHTHSAGTACSVFQSDPDPGYVTFLGERISDAIIRANKNLQPARIGWGTGQEPGQVFNRRWNMKPGTVLLNPFGTHDKVLMNPGIKNPNLLSPAGPTDPEVSIVSIQSLRGEPIALLANYSLHYVGGTGNGDISADYYGMFADKMKQLLKADYQELPFVAIMSNGTSGNINNVDFGGERPGIRTPYSQMKRVANIIAAEAYKVLASVNYQDWISLGCQQKQIALGVRLPGSDEVKRAKEIIAKAKGPIMKTKEEIYARETVLIANYPKQVSIILQAFRLGDLAITAIPCEVFVETGLELKAKSPFKPTFNISLANGYNGYLPTPQHHELGGYETWRARSSYLEVGASSKITETLFQLLETLKKSRLTEQTISSN